jgi:peroxiredoxin
MAVTESEMQALGAELPSFELPDVVSGKTVADAWLRDRVAVVAFICNHCPFVIHLKSALATFGSECEEKGVRMVAVSANDAVTYPQDGPEAMATDAKKFAYPFPYLFDETQDVARQFGAVCTPDFFVYGTDSKLAYRGQFDSSRPSNAIAVTGEDLRAAVDALLAGKAPPSEQRPSIGCNIKWR